MPFIFILFLGLLCFPGGIALADPLPQPDLVSIGAGYANFDKHEDNRKSGDFRLEYRWGLSLLPHISSSFRSLDPYVQFHPYLGVETSSLGVLYGLGGITADIALGPHLVLTWSEGAGLFYEGDGLPMGSVTEFRSMAEIGWRFSNEMRLTAYASHTSNAKLTQTNPGSEIFGVYFHIPARKIFGR